MKVLLPNTVSLDPALPEGWEAAVVDADAPIAEECRDAEVLVLWGGSAAHVASAVRDMPRLRLVQTLSAGVDSVLAAGFAPGVVVAGGGGLHDRTVTEHTLALILTLLRRIPASLAAQARHEWSHDLGGIQQLHPTGRVTTLLGARVLIWGFGGIAQTLAPVLASLGASVTGVARSAGTRAGFPVVAAADVAAELPTTDVLVSILPGGPQTRGVIGKSVLDRLPSRAFVVNVGRGTVLDQGALAHALRSGRLAGAALDVTAPEPLPADDPLWDAPNLVITPHAAGGRPVGADELIAQNVRALVAGGPIRNRAR